MLPSLRFFEPTRKFLRWLIQRAGGKPIYDCGAGDGHVAFELWLDGAKAVALDLHPRDSSFPVLITDTIDYQFPRHSTLLFCRPCHSDWVEQTILKASSLSHGIKDVIYVGLEKNVESDLGELFPLFKKIGRHAGKDDESVWVMKHNPDGRIWGLERWCLLHPSHWKRPSWVLNTPTSWQNTVGGRFFKDRSDVILDSAVVYDYIDLDWLTVMEAPDSDSGFLDPAGRFYGCESREHERFCQLALKCEDSRDLERKGWVHIYGKDMGSLRCDFTHEHVLTEAQRNWLMSHGYKDEGGSYDESGAGREAKQAIQKLELENTTGPATGRRTGD